AGDVLIGDADDVAGGFVAAGRRRERCGVAPTGRAGREGRRGIAGGDAVAHRADARAGDRAAVHVHAGGERRAGGGDVVVDGDARVVIVVAGGIKVRRRLDIPADDDAPEGCRACSDDAVIDDLAIDGDGVVRIGGALACAAAGQIGVVYGDGSCFNAGGGGGIGQRRGDRASGLRGGIEIAIIEGLSCAGGGGGDVGRRGDVVGRRIRAGSVDCRAVAVPCAVVHGADVDGRRG